MIRPNIQYLAFDDRKLLLFGIPLLAIISPLIFFGVALDDYLPMAYQEIPEGMVYTSVFWFFNRFLLIQLRKKFDAFTQSMKRFALQILIIIFTAPIISYLISTILSYFYIIFGLDDLCDPTFMQGLASTYFLTFSVLLLYDTIYFFHKYKEAIMEKEWIQKAHIQSQLDNLRNQINPHFLFNSMNTLMNLIPEEGDRARNYLGKLSKFYRYTVGKQEKSTVPIAMELENALIYVELLKERFGKSLDITIPDTTTNKAHIIPLCMQLLIENAINHNIVSQNKPLHIEVSFTQEGKYLSVKNDIQRKIQAVESTGIGLANIKKRMAFFTEDLVIISTENNCFEVRIPLIAAPK
ncbi:MAG: histidine kinase [Saprospiraceae bacterium]